MTGNATPEMRTVVFPFRDRIVLAPVELVHVALPTIVVAAVFWFLTGPIAALAAMAAVGAGTVLFPVLLPFVPSQVFSTRGLLLGCIVAIPFAAVFASAQPLPGWAALIACLIPLLIRQAIPVYHALYFTGLTTFMSRMGVRKEILRYVPIMTFMAVTGIIRGIVIGVSLLMGVF